MALNGIVTFVTKVMYTYTYHCKSMITIQGYDSTLYILARLKLSAKIAIKCAWDEPSGTVSQGQRRSFCIGKNVARHRTPGVDPQVTRGTVAQQCSQALWLLMSVLASWGYHSGNSGIDQCENPVGLCDRLFFKWSNSWSTVPFLSDGKTTHGFDLTDSHCAIFVPRTSLQVYLRFWHDDDTPGNMSAGKTFLDWCREKSSASPNAGVSLMEKPVSTDYFSKHETYACPHLCDSMTRKGIMVLNLRWRSHSQNSLDLSGGTWDPWFGPHFLAAWRSRFVTRSVMAFSK